jgi:hypothetical protein
MKVNAIDASVDLGDTQLHKRKQFFIDGCKVFINGGKHVNRLWINLVVIESFDHI